jgi:hypothetical protein
MGIKNIPHNNWMKIVAGIDRVQQIRLGLLRATCMIEKNQ